MAAMKPNERTPFSAIDDRPPLKLPDGGRMILWPLMSLEVWDIERAMARTVLPPLGVSGTRKAAPTVSRAPHSCRPDRRHCERRLIFCTFLGTLLIQHILSIDGARLRTHL